MKPLDRQSGISMLEALIAMAIFTIAILGLLALQVNLLQASTQSQYRIEASLLGASMAGLINSDTSNVGCYAVNSASAIPCTSAGSAAAAERWRQDVVTRLPNTQALPGAFLPNPTVSIAADGTAVVILKWQPPRDTAVRNFVVTAQALQ